MIGAVVGKVYDELRAVPITMLFMGGLYGLVSYLVFDHVSKSDFQELRSEMVGVQFTLKRDHADSRLHSIEQELFNLTEHVSDDRSKGKVSDELYDRRIDDLQHQKEEVLRQMAVLDNQEKSP